MIAPAERDASPAPARGPGKWAVLAVLFPLGLVLDQVTKFLAVDRLTTAFGRAGATTLGEKLRAFWELRYLEPLATPPHVVVRPFWRMVYVENPNAAFGFLSFVPAEHRYRLFLLVTVLAVAFVVYYYRRLEASQRLLQVALAFVLAGTCGNFIDRVARRYVIDFVDWHWWNRPDLRWPTFNVADSLLVVGIGLLLIHPSSTPKASPAARSPAPPSRSAGM